MTTNAKTGITVAVVCAAFAALAVAFLSEPGGTRPGRPPIALVDTNFLDTSTTRKSYADLVRAKADLSDFDCYICHEKNKAPPLRLDTNQNIIVAPEHVGPTTFAADDITSNNLAGIIERLRGHADPVSTLLWQGMSNSEQLLLVNYKPSEPASKQTQELVVAVLNKLIGGPCLYEPGRFKGILLGAETIVHLQHSTTGSNLAHLNRLLLEDAYPTELARDRSGDIAMGHGQHGRNNNCFNCHNETNLVLLQPRDGRELTFAESTKLCGSCHGPTLRDWLAGAHGRISGYWDRGPSPFTVDEIGDLPRVVDRLRRQSDPVSAFVWQRLSIPDQALLTNYQPSASNSKPVEEVVLRALNKVIGEPCIYEPERFKGISLGIATASLVQQSPKGGDLIYLNRLLLEEAYPLELSGSQRKDCVNCHNPHYPHFPSRRPAPGPHPLKEITAADTLSARQE